MRSTCTDRKLKHIHAARCALSRISLVITKTTAAVAACVVVTRRQPGRYLDLPRRLRPPLPPPPPLSPPPPPPPCPFFQLPLRFFLPLLPRERLMFKLCSSGYGSHSSSSQPRVLHCNTKRTPHDKTISAATTPRVVSKPATQRVKQNAANNVTAHLLDSAPVRLARLPPLFLPRCCGGCLFRLRWGNLG